MERKERILWNDKRFFSLDFYLKKRFGEKVYKVALDGGMTCPNRDGTLGTRGCIFCSAGGSGDFAAPVCDSVITQINQAIDGIRSSKQKKQKSLICNKFIAYFQSYTNTYAPVSHLRRIFSEAISHPYIVALSIATRPDCISDDVLKLLDELNHIKPVFVELGLQTIHDKTADFIRRGYPLSVFDKSVTELNVLGIETVVHLIIGLPFETQSDLLASIEYISKLPIHGVKLQLLHVLRGTDLADYLKDITILSLEEYIDLIILCLEHLPENIVIHRITGDGPKELLLAPLWSKNKKLVMNEINKTLAIRDSWQGKAR